LQNYFKFREDCGERLGPESPIIREQFDRENLGRIRSPRHISEDAISNNLVTVINKSGVQKRKPKTETEVPGRERKDVARAHGFRKFVETNMIRSRVNPEAREMLLGHSIGLGNSYYRPHPEELLEEYLKAVDMLTINEENRLKRKVEILSVRKEKLDELTQTVEMVRRKLGI
jgi:hypothetical protein